MWAAVVVFVDEVVELGLQLGDGGGAGLVAEVLFEGLVEAFDLAAGGGVIRGGVDLDDAQAADFVLECVAATFAAGESGGEDHAVVGQGGVWDAMGGNGIEEVGDDDGAGDAGVRGD